MTNGGKAEREGEKRTPVECPRKYLVRMKVYGGQATLVVIAADAGHVYVCTPEEWQAAQSENRPPKLVGFMREHIVEYLDDEARLVAKVGQVQP